MLQASYADNLMILAFELTWAGQVHVPTNGATLLTASLAFPQEEIRAFAEETHLAHLRTQELLRRHVTFHSVRPFSLYRGKTGRVSLRRFVREFAVMARALKGAGREPCLMILLSATPTAIFAASWLARLRRHPTAVHVVLHGNANEVDRMRSRNPLLRRFDLMSALQSAHRLGVRFIVLEEAIAKELKRKVPAAGPFIDVLPSPAGKVAAAAPLTLGKPIRIGFVGLATEAKGVAIFLRIAQKYRQKYGPDIEFHHIGPVLEGSDPARFSVLDSPPSTGSLPREEFAARLSRLHYVMLPYLPQYYNLSASGSLIDAVIWRKPIIASRLPLFAEFFSEFGELGFLCDDETEMSDAIDAIMEQPDQTRYEAQVLRLAAIAESRSPEKLAERYRSLVASGFPWLSLRSSRSTKA